MDGTWLVGLLVIFVATPVAIASYVSARRSNAAEYIPWQSATQAQRELTPLPRRPQRHSHAAALRNARGRSRARGTSGSPTWARSTKSNAGHRRELDRLAGG